MEKLADERRQMNVVAVPLLGFHGHVNPMLSFCRTLTSNSRRHGSARDVHVTLIVTKHWLNAEQAKAGSHGVRLSFIEVEAEEGMDGLDADDKEESLERLLDTGLEQPPDLIIADSFVNWAVAIGQRRNIPVASFWPASASAFSVAYHRHLIVSSHHFPLDPLSGKERINLIPGIPSIGLADLPGEIQVNDKWMLNFVTEAVSSATKAQFIIFRTTNELEEAALAALKTAISPDAVPLYAIGPAIPFNSTTDTSTNEDHSYMNWLDTQETNSVLYISLGTYLPTSDAQFDELAIGVRESGVPFLWVARERASHLSEIVGDKGKVVSWCDQMRVLRHSSIGGFVTHCGWNSTLEAAFAGVAALTFPLGLDQTLNSKLMVEDWGIGFRVKSNFQDLVTRDHVSVLLMKFMDSESEERKELDENCKKFRERLLLGVAQDGSTGDLHEFIYTIALPSVIRTN